jgi:hypothetical protein
MAKRTTAGSPDLREERGGEARGGRRKDRLQYARAMEGREPSSKAEPGMGSTAGRGAGERREDRS